jgi:polyferredoxin
VFLMLTALWFCSICPFTVWRALAVSRKGGEPVNIVKDWAVHAFVRGTALILLILIIAWSI